ncbi:MAG: HAD family hydrolase, partial [Bacteroidia bacterium]|nr:HAD family hydrolase [Bacteroidia bacterium]
MSGPELHKLIDKTTAEVLILDYFGGLFNRTLSHNHVRRLWAKILIRELGLKCSIDVFARKRVDAVLFLNNKLGVSECKIPYDTLKDEVLNRLLASGILAPGQSEVFLRYFEPADLKSQLSAQEVNTGILSALENAKAIGLKLIILSDCYASESLVKSFLKHHGIYHLIDGIYVSGSDSKQEDKGEIVAHVLSDLKLTPDQAVYIRSGNNGKLPKKESNNFDDLKLFLTDETSEYELETAGNDKADFNKVIDKTFRACQEKEAPPFSEYIIFFQVFIERLYICARRFNIKTLFFISREGVYLKRLF